MHSFVHPGVIKLIGVYLSQGAALTVTVANGNQMSCHDVLELDLIFSVEGRDYYIVMHSQLYVVEGL